MVIDSGTTTSRVRITDGENVLYSIQKQIGARDVARTGNNAILKEALRACIDEVLESNKLSLAEIEAIIASGMITSNLGLLEIPHLSGPVQIEQIAAQVVKEQFPDITDKPIFFIPGVKTGFSEQEEIVNRDMMRGEEAEIFGYLGSLGPNSNESILFMHYGSHHKGIRLEQGKIVECRTSMTGELMMAISENTILKSSLISLSELEIDINGVKKGMEAAFSHGFGRALFSTRVMYTMNKRNKHEVTSFFIGTLLSLDFDMLDQMLESGIGRVVLYGKELYPSIFAPLLKEKYPLLMVDILSEHDSDVLSARGAAEIYRKHLNHVM
jgi:2-dehydro-3-deoxygalactonokinase